MNTVYRIAAIAGAAALAVWYVRRQVKGVADGLFDGVSAAWDAVEAMAGQAVDTVWSADNMVSAGASSAAPANWGQVRRNIVPLVEYFQKNGNTAASRAEAARAGWTADEISLAVATMGSLNGYY